MATKPIGTLTRKIGRHWLPAMSAETSTPPSACPATAAMPAVAPYQPRALARDIASPVAWMVASVWGTTSEAAAPCRMRAATSQPAVGARPQSSEARVNAAMPAMNTRRRPAASPTRPPITRKTA